MADIPALMEGARRDIENLRDTMAGMNRGFIETLRQYYLGVVVAEGNARAEWKALGMDPRDAPAFGWGKEMPGQTTVDNSVSINTTEPAPQGPSVVVRPQSPPPPDKPARPTGAPAPVRACAPWKAVLTVGLIVALAMLAAAGGMLLQPAADKPAPPAANGGTYYERPVLLDPVTRRPILGPDGKPIYLGPATVSPDQTSPP